MNHLFTSYQEWRSTMIEQARLTLDDNYCKQRLAVLEDENSAETKAFIDSFGAAYHKQVIAWFQQALSEA